MAIPQLDTSQPSQFETCGNVIALPMEWQNEVCEQQYERMLDDFKELLTVINGGPSKPECFEYPPEIVLSRHDDGKVASKVIFNCDSCIYGTVSFSNADGFRVYTCQYSTDGIEEHTDYASFSLLGQNDTNGSRYPNKWQNREQTAATQAWLEEKLSLSTTLLAELWDAAANPNLNPVMAERVKDMVVKHETEIAVPIPLQA